MSRTTRRTVQPPELFDSRPWGFSQVVVLPADGRVVHIAGQVAWNEDGVIEGETREEQLRIALRHVEIALRSVGGTLDDVQSLRLYLPDFQAGPEADMVGQVLGEVFGRDDPPASSWIGVQALAQPEYLVEVEAVAVVPEGEVRQP
jgi:enamine deaminase RidA (YjgF/YER057c/UK114 family)